MTSSGRSDTRAVPPVVSPLEFVARLRRCREASARVVVGLAAPPGAGKSTFADRLRTELGAVVAPMDGFHRSNAELERLGLRDRKGAPETFDADAFVAHLDGVVAGGDDIAWPSFDRSLDEPVDGVIVVPASATVVVVEGNYLLLDRSPWDRVPGMLDDVAYLELDPVTRVQRLIDRHVAHGRSRDDAIEWVSRSDEANARLVTAARDRASVIVAMS